MGVTYKLTEDIVHFILEEKEKGPDLSCRQLVELVSSRFQKAVSKSSVHEVLRQAHIQSPRGRKAKDKFMIPAEKKAQLLANLPAIESLRLAGPAVPAPAAPAVPALLPLQTQESPESLAQVFLTAAFADLFPRPWGNVRCFDDLKSFNTSELSQEWHYRSLAVAAFKLDLANGTTLWIDGRWQGLQRQFVPGPGDACPIERGLNEAAVLVAGGREPVMIAEADDADVLADLAAALSGTRPKALARLQLIGQEAQVWNTFEDILIKKREFIAGLGLQTAQEKGLTNIEGDNVQAIETYLSQTPVRFVKKAFEAGGFQGRALVVLDEQGHPKTVIVTNALANRLDDATVVRVFVQRHPGSLLGKTPGFEPQKAVSAENFLRAYAGQRFLAGAFTDELWQAACDIKAQPEFNAQIWRLNVRLPDSAHAAPLAQAMKAVNALYVKDEAGRPIWLNCDFFAAGH